MKQRSSRRWCMPLPGMLSSVRWRVSLLKSRELITPRLHMRVVSHSDRLLTSADVVFLVLDKANRGN